VLEGCRQLPGLGKVVVSEILRTRVLTIGAAVAFFLLMSLIPLLMVASALLSALPIPNLLQQLLDMLAMFVPPDTMSFVKAILFSILTAHPARILSIGVLSYIWAASGSFSSLIEALNIAYDVKAERSWWRDKLQALLLTFVCGSLSIVSLLCMIAGPHFIHFLSYLIPVPHMFSLLWPPVRIALIFTTFVANITVLYKLAPNRQISLRAVLPGAAFAVCIWFLGSAGLGFYIVHFANYNVTYGSLGAIIVLMLWLYLTSVSILIGAELNAELDKRHIREVRSEKARNRINASHAQSGQPHTSDAA
jgi:membrane protein